MATVHFKKKELKMINIAIAGTGYVGLSIATLLAQHHKVTAVVLSFSLFAGSALTVFMYYVYIKFSRQKAGGLRIFFVVLLFELSI